MANRFDRNGKLSDCEARLVASIERGDAFWPESSLNLANCGPRAHAITGSDGVERDQREYWPFAGQLFALNAGSASNSRAGDKAVLLPPDARLECCLVMLGQTLIAGHCDLSGSDFVREPGQESPFEAGMALHNAVSLAGTPATTASCRRRRRRPRSNRT